MAVAVVPDVSTAAVGMEYGERMVLVANEQLLALLVIVDGANLVGKSLSLLEEPAAFDGVFQYLQFLQSLSAGRFPDNAFG